MSLIPLWAQFTAGSWWGIHSGCWLNRCLRIQYRAGTGPSAHQCPLPLAPTTNHVIIMATFSQLRIWDQAPCWMLYRHYIVKSCVISSASQMTKPRLALQACWWDCRLELRSLEPASSFQPHKCHLLGSLGSTLLSAWTSSTPTPQPKPTSPLSLGNSDFSLKVTSGVAWKSPLTHPFHLLFLLFIETLWSVGNKYISLIQIVWMCVLCSIQVSLIGGPCIVLK